jgi:hypothetical protein
MKVNIGIVTHHLVQNYGAALQTYALKHVLNELGHESHVVDFRHPIHVNAQRIFRPSTKGHARTVVKYATILLRYTRLRKRRARFTQFMQDRFDLTKVYHSYSQLSDDPPPCDAFICGSDQIWSPYSTLDPAYYLGFVEDDRATRIAYAPSFGTDAVPEELEEMFKERIGSIPHLSVREEQGREIIKGLIGKDVDVVLDPTLLLDGDHWSTLAGSEFDCSKPYILVYDLQNRTLLRDVVRQLQRRIGPLPIKTIAASPNVGFRDSSQDIYDAGPEDYLQLFRNAQFVVTDSFHGTAFSILFRKPFFTVPHTKTNSRLSSLLTRLQLQERIVSDPSAVANAPMEVDFARASGLLDQERDKSLAFLKASLGMESVCV